MYIYIYIYIEREREIERCIVYIYIYIYIFNTSLSLSLYIYIYIYIYRERERERERERCIEYIYIYIYIYPNWSIHQDLDCCFYNLSCQFKIYNEQLQTIIVDISKDKQQKRFTNYIFFYLKLGFCEFYLKEWYLRDLLI